MTTKQYRYFTPSNFEKRSHNTYNSLKPTNDEQSITVCLIFSFSHQCTPLVSKVLPDALSYKGFDWFFKMLKFNVALPEYVQVYHEGRCGRCGRKLTTPASIEAGFGPECINK